MRRQQEPDSDGRRARGRGQAEEPAAKRRAINRSERWLLSDGTASKKAPHGSGLKGWATEDVWACVFGQRPEVLAWAPGAEEPWASMAVNAMRRVGPKICDPTDTGRDVHLQISPHAVDLMGKWLVSWLEKLLRDLHILSVHRVGIDDCARAAGSGPADSHKGVVQGTGCVRKPHLADAKSKVSGTWLVEMQRNQQLRRIERKDVRALLQGLGSSSVAVLQSTGVASLQQSLLAFAEKIEADAGYVSASGLQRMNSATDAVSVDD